MSCVICCGVGSSCAENKSLPILAASEVFTLGVASGL